MRSLHYLEAARDDLASIANYVAAQSGSRSMAKDFVSRLRRKCQHLASLPGTLGTARPDLCENLRSTPYQGYVIFFRYDGARLMVINVLHASRDVLAYFHDD